MEKIKKLMNEEGKIEALEPPSFMSFLSQQIMDNTNKRCQEIAEAFKKGIEDGLKGENTMGTMNTLAKNAVYGKTGTMNQDNRTAEDQIIHLMATNKVELDIQESYLLEKRRFLKQLMIEYTDRGEFCVAGELSQRLLSIEKTIKGIREQIDQIKDQYGNDMRYLARIEYLSAIHEDIERELMKAEEELKPAKKTKKSNGSAD